MKNYKFTDKFADKFTLRLAAVMMSVLLSTGNLPAQEKNWNEINIIRVNLFEKRSAEFQVSGIVTDAATGLPLEGAQIKVAGLPFAAISDETGAYKITLPSLLEVLVAGSPDYSLREVPVVGRSVVNIQLYAEDFKMGYGTTQTLTEVKRKAELTYPSADAIDFSTSTALSVETDFQARLGGSVRTITRSGSLDMGAAIFIRGLNSLYATAQPLFVIDGVIRDLQLNNSSVHNGFFSNP
ncbi:MAG: hypothetical protein LBM08_02815, partial [Dysgonamonadaceae bacterium]|nr:hypothetical protein [Dysgonamonadaceae bacterium]